ncbi:hybrid PKS-NRPS enzyme [Apiospora marii]|uniref:Hybrid PKS-NRPS enzyme n=1 Tax=Apiospora marii TaxID=335849 RepID=A0ABR1RFH8_9PEZI
MYEPVAIVGTGCRFPGGASSPSKLWDLLKAPRDVLREFPPERLNMDNFYHEDGERHGRTNVQHKSYLLEEDVRQFDAAFFRINPKEAADMDPQQRVLLETVYEAFEAAGWSLGQVSGSKTSVHVGCMTQDYTLIQSRDPDTAGSHVATGVSQAILANRISYAFNLQGASLTLDTACSSSLVALHLAAQGLQRGETTRAVVAGVNLLLDPFWYITESSMHLISSDSRCRMWDRDAGGYARGEGCAAVVLKTLAQAVRDGDHIECVLRGSLVNSDGSTNGITMPSPSAQAALIRQTYRDAGLDPIADRCQYFECHGTGTQAGDPVEAQAIRDTFFPPVDSSQHKQHGRTDPPLYCGSIKTVTGHLEGCAGLAGVLKASLALQNKAIPPNMHFHQLNPKVEPFYEDLEVPTCLVPWPEPSYDGPRRASVNSFGFGGTNAHAILESYEPNSSSSSSLETPASSSLGSSASDIGNDSVYNSSSTVGVVGGGEKTERALLAYLREKEQSALDIDVLSSSLQSKRTVFPHRAAIPAASDLEDLVQKLEDQVNALGTSTDAGAGFSATTQSPRILGIFTGQGAQTARMGSTLLEHSPLFKQSILACEDALRSIPEPPTWSLRDELAADAAKSRVSEATFSQPLCTAVQIGLVDLLRACGLHFAAVVGHSSGEIGAAYAAGLLTRRDAMGIAYYRGRVAHLSRGRAGEAGGMMAAAMSLDAASALCAEPRFAGRVGVAAANSPSSVTLSGDKDALLEMKAHLEGSGVQARALQVDVAYHSHHMLACADAYLGHLEKLRVRIQTPPAGQECAWYSSVRANTDILLSPLEAGLEAQYWLQNMVQPVLFSQAVEHAVQQAAADPETKLNAVMEIGPHPALKGPASQTLKQTTEGTLPYTSCLRRGDDDVETFSEMLSTIWQLAPSAIDFAGWRTACGLPAQPRVLKDLPPYAWDHAKQYWRESRVGRDYRLGRHAPHDLLGRLWNDARYEHTWRNIFRLKEMPWVRGHVFQGQVLFPATGYLSLAVDAAKAFVGGGGRSIRLIEVHDLSIPTALVIGDSNEVEVLFTIRSRVSPKEAGSVLEAEFACYSYPDAREADKTCDGRLSIHLGDESESDTVESLAPPMPISDVELTPFNVDRFYSAASEIGFGYAGAFRALTSLNRCWGHAKAVASWSPHTEEGLGGVAATLHPAILDVSLQAGLATFVSAAENSMPSAYLPVGIRRALIHPNPDFGLPDGSTGIEIEAFMTSPELGKLTEADINVCGPKKGGLDPDSVTGGGIQLEGVRFKAIAEPQPSEDRNIFAKTVWGLDPAVAPSMYTPEEYERVALFHLQSLAREMASEKKPQHPDLLHFIEATVAQLHETDHPILSREWLADDASTIQALLSRDPDDADMALLASSSEYWMRRLQAASADTTPHDEEESLTSSFYRESRSAIMCDEYMAQMVSQLSHKFPRTNILDLSAGTRNTTSAILGAVGDAYGHYTCAGATDAIVEKAKERLASLEKENVGFKTLDVDGQDLASQGFEAGSYDVVIATDAPLLRPTAVMGGSEAWWTGGYARQGETTAPPKAGPAIATGEWDELLIRHGFSGIDCALPDQDPSVGIHGFSVFSSQATDAAVDILRDPLLSMSLIPPTPLILVGGETSQVSKLVRQCEKLARGWAAAEIQIYRRFEDIPDGAVPPGASVISLQDLDEPLFAAPPSARELASLKSVLESARSLLWVTARRRAGDPYANIMLGIGRALRLESPDTAIHYLDFEDEGAAGWDARALAEEREVVIKDGRAWVPRVVPDPVSNEVYNAKRRRITKLVDPAQPIEIDASSLVCSRPVALPEDLVAVQVQFSVALNDATQDETPCFLCFGHVESGRAVLTLSETDSSVAHIHQDSVFLRDNDTLGGQEGYDAEDLANLASLLIASRVVSSLPPNATTLVCGASERVSDAIRAMVADSTDTNKKTDVLFVSISSKKEKGQEANGWLHIHPKSTARAFRQMAPRGPLSLYGLSEQDTAVVSSWLPTGCTVQRFHTDVLSQQSVEEAARIYSLHRGSLTQATKPVVININEVASHRPASPMSAVTNWKRAGPVPALLRGLEPSALLSPNKTYFLVGMASELGQSLTYFMVRGGARHIVLSSRNPKGGQNWIRQLQSAGVDLRLVKMDVTSRSQVRDTVALLRRTMPEIGGVTNAALVLEPAIFANLSAASIAKQMKPKIYGSAYLDDEFRHAPLDFFMAFGSLATVTGNAGQAIYHAGNAFMMSLIENRRRRGLAASILNFGMLVDVGYVARSDRFADSPSVEDWLRADVPTPLSEADFHHVILQGIAAGDPRSPSGEVIMGLETFYDHGQSSRPRWASMAFFSHMVRAAKAPNDGQALSDDAPHSIQQWKQNLENAASVDEAIPPITELLSRKVESMIHVSLHSIHPDEPMSHLGIDSINAIEIRKWLRENMDADVSMLKILGRDSLSSILRDVAEQYLAKRPAQKPKEEVSVAAAAAPQPIQQTPAPKVAAAPNAPNKSSAADPDDTRSSSNQPSPPSAPQQSALSFTRSERLSYAQAGFFYLTAVSDDPASMNLTARLSIRGRLDAEKFSRAFDKVMQHHDALRTCFLANDDSNQVMQHLAKTTATRLGRLQSTPETAEADFQKAFDEIAGHKYSLATGDTLQAVLVSHGAQWHTFIIGFHNIALDAVSMKFILDDLHRSYQSNQPLTQDAASYLDFTRQQFDDVAAGRLDEGIAYWTRLLDPVPDPMPLLPMAKVRARHGRRSYGCHLVERELGGELVRRVTQISQSNGVPVMHFYLALMRVLLCRLLGVDDLCIGVMSHGRDPTSRFGATVGHVANILPLRFRGGRSERFPEVLEDTFKTVLGSLEHSNVPIAVVLEKTQASRSEGGMPIIQVAYDYRVGESVRTSMGDCSMDVEHVAYTSLYDLTIDVLDSKSTNGHMINIRCTDDFYTTSTTEFIATAFVNAVESVVSDHTVAVKDISLFSDLQLRQAVTAARGAHVEHAWPQTLPERFEQVVASFPDSVAVQEGDEAITYRELQRLVESYASVLLPEAKAASPRIAVLCEPGVELYAAMLAIFHIGAVFVPLDVSLPAARRSDILKVCRPDLLVYHAATAPSATEDHGSHPSLNLPEAARAATHTASREAPPPPKRLETDPGSDSYILFTSGSTGVPKGIKLHQCGMMNYAAHTSQAYGLGQVRVLQQTSVGFDLFFAQAWNAFANGGALVAAPVAARGDPEALSKLILEQRVEMTIGVPSEYRLLLNYAPDVLRECRAWRFCHVGGEPLPERLVEDIRDLRLPSLTLTNVYGPAEAFIVTHRDIQLGADTVQEQKAVESGYYVGGTPGEYNNVGYVLPNLSIYITSEADDEDGDNDHKLSPLPPGVAGEICIAGSSVSNGYLLDHEGGNDNKAFVANPFATSTEDQAPGFDQMYRTGDRGYLAADGSLVFLGRRVRSGMIKLRGLRLDLREVAGAVLAAAPDDLLAEAVVTVRGEDAESQFLVCHVVLKKASLGHSDGKPQHLTEPGRLAALLLPRLRLPQYMIPSAIVPLERLPVSANGKLDTGALERLPLPESSSGTAAAAAAPAQGQAGDDDETEAVLRSVWVDVIGPVARAIRHIGPDASFFSVGGNSLLLVQLQHAIHRRFGVKIHLRQLREIPDLRALAAVLRKE